MKNTPEKKQKSCLMCYILKYQFLLVPILGSNFRLTKIEPPGIKLNAENFQFRSLLRLKEYFKGYL